MKLSRERHYLVLLLLLFMGSRAAVYGFGVRFDDSHLPSLWQVLDLELLRNSLLESLYYLHSQPPLFNLFIGLVLKIFAGHERLVFHGIYFGLGLSLTAAMFLTVRRLGVGTWLSFVLVSLFVLSPACILYENWLFYTYPTTVLLVLAAWMGQRFFSNERARDGHIFFLLLAATVLIRSLFHVAWLYSVAGAWICLARPRWKQAVAILFLPIVLTTGWYFKNYSVFGRFTASTWLGLSLSKMTTMRLEHKLCERWVKRGRLSKLALVPVWEALTNIDLYPVLKRQIETGKTTGIAALDEFYKAGNQTNCNHLLIVKISPVYLEDAIRVIQFKPWLYLGRMLEAWVIYFSSPSHYPLLTQNREHVQLYDQLFTAMIYGQQTSLFVERKLELYPQDSKWEISPGMVGRWAERVGLFVILLYGVIIAFGIRLILFKSQRAKIGNADRLTLMFLWWTIVYVGFFGNAVEWGENERFRFMTDPLALVFLGFMLQNWEWPRKLAVNRNRADAIESATAVSRTGGS